MKYERCKCETCRIKHNAYNRAYKAKKRREAGIEPRNKPTHGSPGMYSNHKCRCSDCTTAWTTYIAARRAKSKDSE